MQMHTMSWSFTNSIMAMETRWYTHEKYWIESEFNLVVYPHNMFWVVTHACALLSPFSLACY